MKILAFLSTLIIATSCSSRFYNYDISMTHPLRSKTLEYETDTFSIVFDPRSKMIGFTILNKSNDGIKINWDEVSFSINGQAQRSVHKETGVLKINDVQPPTTIPPKSTLEDFIIPTNNIRYASVGMRTYTITGNILPVEHFGKKNWEKTIRTYKGTKITIFLPFYIGGKYFSHYYDLMINDVTLSKGGPIKATKSK